MPCCLRLLAIKVAPSTSLMLFLLLDRAGADRRARCRQGPGPKKSPSADYAFMAMTEKGLSQRTCYTAIVEVAGINERAGNRDQRRARRTTAPPPWRWRRSLRPAQPCGTARFGAGDRRAAGM